MHNSIPRIAALLALAGAVALAEVRAIQDHERATRRAGDRIHELMREAEALAAQQSKLLVELRGLESDRQAKAAEVERIEREMAQTRRRLADTETRFKGLQHTAETERPDVELRLVELYKLGGAGHWRMLLDVDDLQSLGRTYRHAAALTRISHDRVRAHQQTLAALAEERKVLEARVRELAVLQQDAVRARSAVARTVAARTTLVDSIDRQRDLNAQMTGELQSAQQRVQSSFRQLEGSPAGPVALPIGPFRGALPWPARGRILAPFGRQPSSRFGTAIVRNGVELEVAEGQLVTAVHDGAVAFAGEFTGYGTLVIVDHGNNAFTLYGHLGSLRVARGDLVEARSPIGLSGRNPSGAAALYFELRIDGRPVDPVQWLQRTP